MFLPASPASIAAGWLAGYHSAPASSSIGAGPTKVATVPTDIPTCMLLPPLPRGARQHGVQDVAAAAAVINAVPDVRPWPGSQTGEFYSQTLAIEIHGRVELRGKSGSHDVYYFSRS